MPSKGHVTFTKENRTLHCLVDSSFHLLYTFLFRILNLLRLVPAVDKIFSWRLFLLIPIPFCDFIMGCENCILNIDKIIYIVKVYRHFSSSYRIKQQESLQEPRNRQTSLLFCALYRVVPWKRELNLTMHV